MNIGLDRAMREWGYEVEAEAERLIKRGVPPWTAIERARDNVSRKRARQAGENDITDNAHGCPDHDAL